MIHILGYTRAIFTSFLYSEIYKFRQHKLTKSFFYFMSIFANDIFVKNRNLLIMT